MATSQNHSWPAFELSVIHQVSSIAAASDHNAQLYSRNNVHNKPYINDGTHRLCRSRWVLGEHTPVTLLPNVMYFIRWFVQAPLFETIVRARILW